MKFKTYGAALNSLSAHVRTYRECAHVKFQQTPAYFSEMSLATHEAFEDWCGIHGFAAADMNEIRVMLVGHAHKYGPKYQVLRDLIETLPNAYNVRGQWTPQKTG